jgi:hypothetical protein
MPPDSVARDTPPPALARGGLQGDLRGAEERRDGLGRAQRASMSDSQQMIERNERSEWSEFCSAQPGPSTARESAQPTASRMSPGAYPATGHDRLPTVTGRASGLPVLRQAQDER